MVWWCQLWWQCEIVPQCLIGGGVILFLLQVLYISLQENCECASERQHKNSAVEVISVP